MIEWMRRYPELAQMIALCILLVIILAYVVIKNA